MANDRPTRDNWTMPMIVPAIATISMLMILFANAVILLNHPVKSVLSLIACFLCASILWLIFGAEYLALVLIFLYVGAVMTLFLFMVMMMNVDSYTPDEQFTTKFSVMILTLTILVPCAIYGLSQLSNPSMISTDIASVKLSSKNESFTLFSSVLYQDYFWVIQIVGLILAVPIVLAAGIVKQGANTHVKQQKSSEQLAVRSNQRLTLVDTKQVRKKSC